MRKPPLRPRIAYPRLRHPQALCGRLRLPFGPDRTGPPRPHSSGKPFGQPAPPTPGSSPAPPKNASAIPALRRTESHPESDAEPKAAEAHSGNERAKRREAVQQYIKDSLPFIITALSGGSGRRCCRPGRPPSTGPTAAGRLLFGSRTVREFPFAPSIRATPHPANGADPQADNAPAAPDNPPQTATVSGRNTRVRRSERPVRIPTTAPAPHRAPSHSRVPR